MINKEDINDEDLIKLFNLDKDDIECIEKYKQNGEGRLSNSQISFFKEWTLTNSEDPEVVLSKKQYSQEYNLKVPINKSKCSKAHPEAPCSGDKPREKNGCCYKELKQTVKTKKKSKNSGGGRRKNNFRNKRYKAIKTKKKKIK